ncbi:MAG TPA: hypoxanthine phosphoribosyltransferase [Gaiellaceae bacterium]|nr:hypoxanthine phosphoribosyltransferase [Gaiellaceae bacterium]
MYLSREEIARRVAELGGEIARDYAGRDLVLVTVLKGAFMFAADLARAIPMPHAMDFLVLAGYGGNLGGRSRIRIIKDLDLAVGGRDVLLLENVVDTGLTLNYVVKTLSLRGPRDLAICSLFDRPYRRLLDDLPIRYVGFTIPDEFFVGYGFHLHERFRGLPDLHVLEQA